MKAFIVSVLFLASLVMGVPVSLAQQDPGYQKLVQEVEVLKEQVLTLQSQLQTVENVEKMELMTEFADAQAKLSDANAKLMNAEFGKFERDLKDSNDGWLRTWSHWFLAIIGFFVLILGGAFWSWLKSKADQMIENEVGKRVNRFEEAVSEVDVLKDKIKESIGQVNILGGKIRVLDKEHAAGVVERFIDYPLHGEGSHSEEIRALSEEALLDVFRDGTRNLYIRTRASVILTYRGSDRFISPAFELLNSILDSHENKKLVLYTAGPLGDIVDLLGYRPTQETYEGLIKFLDRLVLREDTGLKDLLLSVTASSFARVGHELNKEDWISLLKSAFSRLDNEPETMKGILHRLRDEMPRVDDFKDYLLELLEQHDAEFVNDWREQRANANTETEETL